jgi:two-component sensor histidine kinase
LVSNSHKHAFGNSKQGAISIEFNGINFDYSDSGKWKENSSCGFGLDLIDLLSKQLDGT